MTYQHPGASPSTAKPRVAASLVGLRALVVDDHEIVAQSLVLMLRAEGVAAARIGGPTFAAIHETATEFAPAVVLLDYDLGPLGPALPLIEPLTKIPAAVVMFSASTDRMALAEAIELGAVGLIGKWMAASDVLEVVLNAATSGTALGADERHALLAELWQRRAERKRSLKPFERLTNREQEVLSALGDGLSATEIAAANYLSVFTVRGHIRSILTKLGVNSQLAAVAMAKDAAWLPPNGQS